METVKDLKLYKEDGKYYLSALINQEDNYGCYEISIPKIRFPVSSCYFINNTYGDSRMVGVNFGFREFYAEPFNDEGHYFTITCLEEKVHEMTLAEIERELGYKIKLKEN